MRESTGLERENGSNSSIQFGARGREGGSEVDMWPATSDRIYVAAQQQQQQFVCVSENIIFFYFILCTNKIIF